MADRINISTLEIRQLRHVLALNKMGNFRRAAKTEYITQPALTKSIQSIENKLNRKLFLRQPNGVSPTKYGLTVIHYSQKVMSALQNMVDVLQDINKSRTDLVLGIDSPISEWIVDNVLEAILLQKSDVKIHTIINTTDNLRESLRNSTIDLAVFTSEEKASDTENHKWQLPEQNGVIYVRNGHELQEKSLVFCEDLLAFPFIGIELPHQITPWILQETSLKYADINHLLRIDCATNNLSNSFIKNTDGWGCAPFNMIKKMLDSNIFTAIKVAELNYIIRPYILSSTEISSQPLVKSIVAEGIQFLKGHLV